jgi:cytochrome c553
MKLRLALIGVLSLTAFTGCAQPPPVVAVHSAPKTPLPPQTPVVPFGEAGKHQLIVKDLMRYVINPAAENFWQWGGEVDGKVRTPTTDAEWNDALAAASTIMAASNILATDPRAQTDPKWAQWAADLNNAGAAGIKTVQARNGEAVFDAGSDMFEACAACHGKYIRSQLNPRGLPALPDGSQPKNLQSYGPDKLP